MIVNRNIKRICEKLAATFKIRKPRFPGANDCYITLKDGAL